MPMNQTIPFFTGLISAAAALAAGSWLAGRWWLALLLLPVFLAGWLLRRRPWLPSTLLVTAVFLAGVGLLLGAPPFLMVTVASAALAGWEFSPVISTPSLSDPSTDRSRLALLLVSILLGLGAAGAGLLLRLALPFSVSVLGGALVLFGLYRFYRLVNPKE